jgi:hypothetical protein
VSFATHAMRTLTLALLAGLSWPLSALAQTQTPFTGMPIALPGTIEAENFDNGGEGVAYHDNVAGNAGGEYRTTDVDIIVTRDPAGGGFVVNNFETGEWLEYTVDIAAAGQYEIAIRTANGGATPTSFRVEIDGNNVTGSVAVPPTGGWSVYQWVAKRGVSLPAGQHVLRLVSEQQYFDVNQIRVTATPTTPFAGVIALPGTFEAENYDNGGQDISYSDTTAANDGGQFRNDGVDIINSRDPEDAGAGYGVNGFRTGEWMVYTVSVANTGLYDIEARVATGTSSTAALHVEIDGVNVTGSLVPGATGNFQTYVWVKKPSVQLSAGQHVLKLVSDQEFVDVNRMRVTAVTHTPFSGAPISLPGTFEAEDFDRGGEGFAYHDNVPGNLGGKYRTDESVDIIVTRDPSGGGYSVNNFETGEWLVYTVNVAQNGNYDVELRLASGTFTGAFHVEIDGQNVTGTVSVPATGDFGTYAWVGKKSVPLTAGQHALKLVSEQQYFDVNQIRVVASAPPSGEVKFSCSFESGWTQCGLTEQAKVIGQRATLVNFGRDGAKAVRLHTEPGDTFVSGSGNWTRNDLRLDASPNYCNEGQEEWWAHSTLFPNDYVASSDGVVMDFHHITPPGVTGGQANFHVFAGASYGLKFVGFGGPTMDGGVYQAPISPTIQKNKWYDFVYHVRWSSGADGFMHAWVDGQKKLTHHGPTLYAGMSCYLKLANYHRADPAAARSVIHDRVMRGTTAEAVSLTPLQP